jgi:hypothetical protein
MQFSKQGNDTHPNGGLVKKGAESLFDEHPHDISLMMCFLHRTNIHSNITPHIQPIPTTLHQAKIGKLNSKLLTGESVLSTLWGCCSDHITAKMMRVKASFSHPLHLNMGRDLHQPKGNWGVKLNSMVNNV